MAAVLSLAAAACGSSQSRAAVSPNTSPTSTPTSSTPTSSTTSAPSSSSTTVAPATTTTTTSVASGPVTEWRAPAGASGTVAVQVTPTTAGAYVAWAVGSPGGLGPSTLERVDPATGSVEATATLPAAFGGAALAGGSLWVATYSSSGVYLLRLDPSTLAVTSTQTVATGAATGTSVALAGGGLWVAAGSALVRFDTSTGAKVASATIAGAFSSDVAASPGGSTLVVGESDAGGAGAVQARNPSTGALLASRALIGVTAPAVAGVSAGGVWASEATGMEGYVQRFSLPGLTPDTATTVQGSNGIRVRVAGSFVWVSQPAGSSTRNFCASGASGARLAGIPAVGSSDQLLAVGAHRYYVLTLAATPAAVVAEPLPAACGG